MPLVRMDDVISYLLTSHQNIVGEDVDIAYTPEIMNVIRRSEATGIMTLVTSTHCISTGFHQNIVL